MNYFKEPYIPLLKEELYVEENTFLEEFIEIIKEEIIEEVVIDLDEVKLDDCNIQAPIILVGGIETKFINFIRVERFDLNTDSYLVNIVNCMKIKGQEVQIAQLMTFKFGKSKRPKTN